MEPFKNLISLEVATCIADHLARQLKRHAPSAGKRFDAKAFLAGIAEALPKLELKQRSQHIADALHEVLPPDLTVRYAVLRGMLHPKPEASMTGASDAQGIRGWGVMPLCRVVSQHGLSDFPASLDLLKEMTQRFTSEFDVRPFLHHDLNRTLNIMRSWLSHPSLHVRRLVSEGTRPRLPWGMQLTDLVRNPDPILPLLKALRDDPEEYVRRSVANSLNDIAKDHPDRVAALAKDWMRGASPERRKLLRHACRTLIKSGHAETLEIFGFAPAKLKVEGPELSASKVALGKSLGFEVALQSTASRTQSLSLDYVMHFRRANGSLSPKVFKWKVLKLEAGERMLLQRNHVLRKVTTREYYSGEQALSVRINGKDYGYATFDLRTSSK